VSFRLPQGRPIPQTAADWRILSRLRRADLEALGLKPSCKVRGKTLMVLPAEWFTYIPTGFHVVDHTGAKSAFNANMHDREGHEGFLNYGVLA